MKNNYTIWDLEKKRTQAQKKATKHLVGVEHQYPTPLRMKILRDYLEASEENLAMAMDIQYPTEQPVLHFKRCDESGIEMCICSVPKDFLEHPMTKEEIL